MSSLFSSFRFTSCNETAKLGAYCSEEKCTTRFFLNVADTDECAGSDWVVFFLLCILVHTVSWWPRWLVYEPAFCNWMRKSSHSGWSQATAEKFSQSVTAASFHITMSIFAWRVLRDKDWLWDIEQWSDDMHLDNKSIEPDFKLYYLLYAARYTSDLVSLFFEHSRSDTFAYAMHHVVSIGLVLLSAHVGCTRIGGVVMFFFDWADPPMLIGKAFLYLSLEADDVYQQIADIFMGIFVVLFVATRNVVFTGIVYICLRDFPNTSPVLALKAMLLVLVGLMTFWLCLIVKIIYNQFFNNEGHVDDIREEDEDVDAASKKQL